MKILRSAIPCPPPSLPFPPPPPPPHTHTHTHTPRSCQNQGHRLRIFQKQNVQYQASYPVWRQVFLILFIYLLLLFFFNYKHLSCSLRNYNLIHARPGKILISLHIHSLIRIFTPRQILDNEVGKFLHADHEDWSDCAEVQVDLSLCLA